MAKKRSKKRSKKRVSKKRVTKKRGSVKRATKKRATKKTGTRRGSLASASASDLRRELQRRSRGVATLERKRDRLLGQLAQVEKRIADAGGAVGAAPRAGGGRRPRNAKNLTDSLYGVVKGKTVGVTEAADAVQKAGYQTTAKNFRTIVNQALIRDKRFKKVSRGKYTA